MLNTVEYAIHSNGQTTVKLNEFALINEQATYADAYKLAQTIGLDRLHVVEYGSGRPKHAAHVVASPVAV